MGFYSDCLMLIRDIQTFIQQEWEEGNIPFSDYPRQESLKVSSRPRFDPLKEKKNELPSEISLPKSETENPFPKEQRVPFSIKDEEQKASELPPNLPLKPSFEHTVEKWRLAPLENPEEKDLDEIKDVMLKAIPRLKWEDPYAPIVILFPEGKDEQMDFLKNVTKAVSQTIAPARLVTFKSGQKIPPCNLCMAPLSLLKGIKGGEIHVPFNWKEGQTFFPLADSDAYLQDQQLKRSLWNALKALSFPAMPQ